jgi:putative transposase
MDILKRIRTDPAIVAYSPYLCFNSRSYRLASKSLEPLKKRTYVAIWKWVQKYSRMTDRFVIGRRKVKKIFVDETLLKINGQDYWLWLAYEPNLHVCLMFRLSRERTIFVCYQFFKQIRTKFGSKSIYTDGDYWYNDACKWLRLKHVIYGTDLKNIMERFIQPQIKDRTECFDDNFPCKIIECERKHVNNWLRLFLLYLYTKADRTMFTNILIKCS